MARKKSLPLLVRFFRAAALYPCFLAIWALSMVTMGAFFVKEVFLLVAAAIWMPFVFFSVARVFAEQDKEGNRMLAETRAESLWGRIRVLLCSPVFWIDAGVVLALFLVLPAALGFFHVKYVVLAGLSATGTTEISEIYHIERGYENFVGKFKALGADIMKISND